MSAMNGYRLPSATLTPADVDAAAAWIRTQVPRTSACGSTSREG